MGICRLHVFFLCMVASVISGCQTKSTNQSTTTFSSNPWSSSTALETAKKPKYAPFDWKPEDADSREIWFQETPSYGEFCKNGYFFSENRKFIYLRNGNSIFNVTSHDYLHQILSVKVNPEFYKKTNEPRVKDLIKNYLISEAMSK